MFKDIKDVFDKHLHGIKYDKALYNKLKLFRINWSVKSDDYIDFLGGNLIGVQDIRFSTRDEDAFFVDILNIDQNNLKMDIFNTKGINPSWKVSSNPTYLTLLYLMYAFYNSKDIDKDLENVLRELYYIFAYKAISSLIMNGFKFTVKPAIAKATYERLSNRFIIKKIGSWQKLFTYRSLDIMPTNGLHNKAIKRFTTDDAIKIANDVQGRIRDTFKNIYGVMVEVINEDIGLINTTTNVTKDSEGDEKNADITHRQDKYIIYLNSIISKPSDFVHEDVLIIIATVLPNLDINLLRTALLHISKVYVPNSKIDIIKSSMLANIEYLNSKNYSGDYLKDIIGILVALKGMWSSSRVKIDDVAIVKKEVYDIVKKAIDKKSKWVIVTTTIGVFLYVFLRSITKR